MSNNHQESFWTKYVFSQDHKWIGIQYGVTALFFMLFGFILMIFMIFGKIEIIAVLFLFSKRFF